jgi:hypothetical protein
LRLPAAAKLAAAGALSVDAQKAAQASSTAQLSAAGGLKVTVQHTKVTAATFAPSGKLLGQIDKAGQVSLTTKFVLGGTFTIQPAKTSQNRAGKAKFAAAATVQATVFKVPRTVGATLSASGGLRAIARGRAVATSKLVLAGAVRANSGAPWAYLTAKLALAFTVVPHPIARMRILAKLPVAASLKGTVRARFLAVAKYKPTVTVSAVAPKRLPATARFTAVTTVQARTINRRAANAKFTSVAGIKTVKFGIWPPFPITAKLAANVNLIATTRVARCELVYHAKGRVAAMRAHGSSGLRRRKVRGRYG